MKIITLTIFMVLSVFATMAQYKPVDKKSSVQFTIKNLGFDVKGTFTGVQGGINFDVQSPGSSTMDITVDANTVNTDNNLRDSHLKEVGYFDVKDYPVIHFVSSKIIPAGKAGNYIVTGKLTIKGKSKDVVIPFSITQGNDGLLFKGSFKINRKDYDVGGGISTIANELEIALNVTAAKT